MKSNLLCFPLLLAMILWLSGCSEKSEEPARIIENLVVTPLACVIANAADTAWFEIQADDRWTVTSNDAWLTPHPAQGTLDAAIGVIAAPNTGAERTGSITIDAPDHYPPSVTVQIRQLTVPPLKVYPGSFSLGWQDQSAVFHVNAPGAWYSEENLDWISITPDSGVGNGDLTCVFGVNPDEQRQAVISISAPFHYPTSTLVTITQAAHPAVLSVIPEERTVENNVEASAFSIFSQGPWSITQEGNWFSVIPHEGSGNDYLRLTFQANTGTARSGTITIYAPDHLPETLTVSITQKSSPTSPPAAPDGLTKVSLFWDAFELSWNDVGDNEQGYTIEYSEVSLPAWQNAGQTPSDVTHKLIESLHPETDYLVRVKAFNGFGISESSPVYSFRTATAIRDLPADRGAVQGLISPATDHDWYRCQVAQEGNCSFKVQLVNLSDSEIWLYGPDDRTRERLYDDNSGGGKASQIDAWLPAGVYFLRVGARGETETGAYSVTFNTGS